MMNKKLAILLFCLVVVMMGYGIAMPVFPFLIDHLGGRGIHFGLLIASYGLMQFIFAPLWGSLSDKIGRKPLLLIGMLGLSFAMLVFAFATQLWMLYTAQIFAGGLSSAALPSAQAYAADITPKKDRSGAMGKIGGAIGLGIVLGPGLGGWMASISLSAPFFMASGFAFLTFIIILWGLPESLSLEHRTVKTEFKIFPVKDLWKALFTPIGFGLVTVFIAIFCQAIFSSVFGLYALARFNYGPEQIGTILMVMALMFALAQGLLVGPLSKKVGEQKVISFSFLGASIGFLFILFSGSYLTIMLSMSFFVLFTALLKPSALAFVSKNATGGQGKVMGMAESYMSMGRIIGPLWGGAIFDVNINFPFMSGILITFVAFLVSLKYIHQKMKGEQEKNLRPG